MSKIQEQIKNPESSLALNSKNIVSQSLDTFNNRKNELSTSNPSDFKKIKLLDDLTHKKNFSTLKIENSESFDENRIQANTSYDIQTVNKIETSKPRIIRNLVLKFRNIIQNEIRSTLNPIVNNQIKFNIHITRSVNGLKKILDQVERQLSSDIINQRKHVDQVERQSISDITSQRKRIDVLTLFSAYNMYLKRDPTKSELQKWLSDDYESDPSYQLFSEIRTSNESKNMFELTENFDSLISKKTNDAAEVKKVLEQESHSDKKHAISFVNFKKILQTNTNPFSERHTEYLWALKNIPTEGKLLDVGSLDSELANELSKINNLQVFGIDIREPDETPMYNFTKEDCTSLSFQNSFFDFVSVISSIEHFGLSFYGSKVTDNADKLAMIEIKRVLKNHGLLFLTIPFGKNSKPWSRVYDVTSLNNLLDDFEVIEEKYYEQTYDGWIETSKEKAELNECAIFREKEESSGAITCILAKLNK